MYSCHVLGAAERRKTVLESQELRALAGEREEEWSRKGDREVANIKGSQFSVIRIESEVTVLPSPKLAVLIPFLLTSGTAGVGDDGVGMSWLFWTPSLSQV